MAAKKKINLNMSQKRRAHETRRQQESAFRKFLPILLLIISALFVVFVIISNMGTPQPASSGRYDAYPDMVIDPAKAYFATIELEKGGKFVIELYPEKAPLAVNSFVFLAREKYFDGTTFHRVLEGFMAQGGDPNGTGAGGPGYTFKNEDSDLVFDKAGVVAMANAGRDTNGSQFFITFGAAQHLNGGYTIFGQVIEGMDVVMTITLRDPNLNPDFTGDVIKSITIEER